MDGKVVATHKRYPAGQADHIRLRLDDEGMRMEADGSDVVTVIAEVVDKRGTVKRLNNSIIRFTVEGEGRLLGGDVACVNPMPVVWGSAPALIQATGRAGKIAKHVRWKVRWSLKVYPPTAVRLRMRQKWPRWAS